MRMIGVVVLCIGIMVLAFGGFGSARQAHDAKLASVEISTSEKKPGNVPVWAGMVLAVLGGGLLLTSTKYRIGRV